MIGYLKWCGRRLVREPLAWASSVMLMGFVAAAAGCPDPWWQYTVMLGAVTMLIYALGMMVQVSYQRYRREQQDLADELRRK